MHNFLRAFFISLAVIVVFSTLKVFVLDKVRAAPTSSEAPWKNDPVVGARCDRTTQKPWECDPIVKR